MKKTMLILLAVLIAVSMFTGCKKEPEIKSYTVGDTGPAGGVIFYDVDADNDVQYTANDGTTKTNEDGLTSAELGWRYLEVAPADLEGTYIFGYYRTSDSGANEKVGTKDGIGEGKANTEALVKAMGETTYSGAEGKDKVNYAAKACADYTYGGYDDWFLPSLNELSLLDSLRNDGTWKNDFYWSSTEYSNTVAYREKPGNHNSSGRNGTGYVRAIRAF